MTISDETILTETCSPGAQLAAMRQQQGFTQEYVANKLHLRVRIMQLIEADEYERLPEPVFVKGYLRAYAKLLGVNPEPIVAVYKANYMTDTKMEKTLWQSKKEPVRAERLVKWFTMLFAAGVLIAVGIWWQQNRAAEQGDTAHRDTRSDLALNNKVNSEVRLTDLSKMQSLFSAPNISVSEKKDD